MFNKAKFIKLLIFLLIFPFFAVFASPKTKFYNFDDLLINGKVKKPQVLYTDARQKVKFERLLKLRKDFIPKLKNTRKDPSLR
jgi:hypothetical protein|tara:strand:+ start:3743 stop:3991 length:249 start_codon:yes stop_codon:yes gene_type:complete